MQVLVPFLHILVTVTVIVIVTVLAFFDYVSGVNGTGRLINASLFAVFVFLSRARKFLGGVG